MFRNITRIKQVISKDECIEILKKQLRGVLSVNGEDGYPYGLPINHFYNDEDGYLYFHSGKIGYKVEMMRQNDKVSFCVMDDGFIKEGDWALNIRSVIAFGRIEFIDDQNVIERICRKLCHKFTNDEEYIQDEIDRSLKNTLMFRMKIEHLTGKVVNEK